MIIEIGMPLMSFHNVSTFERTHTETLPSDVCQAFARLCQDRQWHLLEIDTANNDIQIFGRTNPSARVSFEGTSVVTNPLLDDNAVPNDLILNNRDRKQMLLT